MGLFDHDLKWNLFCLALSNGESVQIAEINISRINDESIKTVILGIKDIPRFKADDLEAAIRGYDDPIKNKLGSPGHIKLRKKEPSLCKIKRSCLSFDKSVCITNHVEKRLPAFPTCFQYDDENAVVSFIMTEMIIMMRENRIVVITD